MLYDISRWKTNIEPFLDDDLCVFKKMAIFRCFKFLKKTHKSSFKNGLIFVFRLDISKSIKKSKFNSIFKNRQVGFVTPLQGRPYVRKRSILLIASQLMEGAKNF